MSLKPIEELYVMTRMMQNLKIDVGNLTNFGLSARKSQRFSLQWAPYELKKYRGVIFHETEEGYKIWTGIDSLFQNWHKEFDKI